MGATAGGGGGGGSAGRGTTARPHQRTARLQPLYSNQRERDVNFNTGTRARANLDISDSLEAVGLGVASTAGSTDKPLGISNDHDTIPVLPLYNDNGEVPVSHLH